jgi:hypothetical protein
VLSVAILRAVRSTASESLIINEGLQSLVMTGSGFVDAGENRIHNPQATGLANRLRSVIISERKFQTELDHSR